MPPSRSAAHRPWRRAGRSRAAGGGAHRCVATTPTVGLTRHSDVCRIVAGRWCAAALGAQNDNTTCGRGVLSRLRSQANVANVDWCRAPSARPTATAVNELINSISSCCRVRSRYRLLNDHERRKEKTRYQRAASISNERGVV